MSHIHTNPGEHDHTVSAYIIRNDSDLNEPKIMLHKHKKLGVYLQFGGHIELNENPWEAIAHELTEESGYNINQMKIMQPKLRIKRLDKAVLHPIPVAHNTHRFDPEGKHIHSDTGYLFITDESPAGTIDEGESEDIQLFTKDEIIALGKNHDIFDNVMQISLFCLELASGSDSSWELVDASSFSTDRSSGTKT